VASGLTDWEGRRAAPRFMGSVYGWGTGGYNHWVSTLRLEKGAVPKILERKETGR